MVKPSRKQFLNELRNLPRPQKGVFDHADHAWRENEVPRPLSRGLRLACLSFCFGRLLSEAQLSFCEFAAYQKFPNSDVKEKGRRSVCLPTKCRSELFSAVEVQRTHFACARGSTGPSCGSRRLRELLEISGWWAQGRVVLECTPFLRTVSRAHPPKHLATDSAAGHF